MQQPPATRTVSYIPYSFVPNHTATIEALARSQLSGRQFRAVLFIMRQTDGYLRNEDSIRPGFFTRNTSIGKDHVPHVLKSLQNLRVITIRPGNPPTYSVNPPADWKDAAFANPGERTSPNPARKFAKNGEKQLYPKDNLQTTHKDRHINKRSTDPRKYKRGRYGHLVQS